MLPNNPCLFKTPYNNKPTTTVGSAINVFKQVIKKFLPMKSFKATYTPSGMLINVAINTAIKETFNEVQTTLNKDLSKLIMRLREEIVASRKKFRLT